MFLTQDYFLHQTHVPHSTLEEYSSILDHHQAYFLHRRLIYFKICHCFIPVCWFSGQCISIIYIAALIEWAFIGSQSTQPWPCLPSYSPVSGLYFSYIDNQTKELVPETCPATRESRHQLGPVLAAWRWRICSSRPDA